MRWKVDNDWRAISDCGEYLVVKNYDDLYTPWHLEHGEWIHIDGRGCDTAKEAAQVCERHQRWELAV